MPRIDQDSLRRRDSWAEIHDEEMMVSHIESTPPRATRTPVAVVIPISPRRPDERPPESVVARRGGTSPRRMLWRAWYWLRARVEG